MPIYDLSPKASRAYTIAEIQKRLAEKKEKELRVNFLKHNNQNPTVLELKSKKPTSLNPIVREVKKTFPTDSRLFVKETRKRTASAPPTHQPPGLKRS